MPWTEFEHSFVRSRQLDAYRRLADRLPLGGDPQKAMARFRIRQPSLEEMIERSRAVISGVYPPEIEAQFYEKLKEGICQSKLAWGGVDPSLASTDAQSVPLLQ